MSHSLYDLLPRDGDFSSAALLGRFLEYVDCRGLSLYPAQEEAILELFDGKNVILNTPTGSGKSLVAMALHFQSLTLGRRSVYTCPIKALVNEKWMALCKEFGPQNVGLSTGDATVNRDAPILCCTAEILSNIALKDGEFALVQDIVMDEFHYYADRERGVAWQIPLLILKHSRFLLMSATLGDTAFFEQELENLTKRPSKTIKSSDRPVPLTFTYVETPLPLTLEKLVQDGKAPIYVVHFTQNDAADSAQDFTSLNLCSRDEKAAIAGEIDTCKFSSPYGPELKRFLRQGIGVHHAGLLPKYRILVEQLAQKGLLKIICGTDTLGVGINVPIRTVLFTKLCKYNGEKTAILSARDFHQIAGRAGRKGFDDLGFVVAQAPEHVIENLKLAAKTAGGGKKFVKRQPPERGYVHWDEQTFNRLINASPEQLQSRFKVSHGMLLNVLSRNADGCAAMRELISKSHETDRDKAIHRHRGWQLFRALLNRKIVEFSGAGRKLNVNVELQDDFSMDQTISLYLIETLLLIDRDSETYALDLLTLVESILENPDTILKKQLDRLKAKRLAELKAEGMEYDQRVEELSKLEYPKPLRDFIYSTFNEFSDRHPWVGQENIRPKSVAREMFETWTTFADYVRLYDLRRCEGLLLRHLNGTYKVLARTVPDSAKTDEVIELEGYLQAMLRAVDSSLMDAWEKMQNPDYQPTESREPILKPQDLTIDTSKFLASVRARIFTFLACLAGGNWEEAIETLDAFARRDPVDAEGTPWTSERLEELMIQYLKDHRGPLLNPEGRNLRHTYSRINLDNKDILMVQQMLVDEDSNNDWFLGFEIDLGSSREYKEPIMDLNFFCSNFM
ncbi:MAG: DUF3516 domain-containing protein [Holophagales bacterium]|jgi:superfamily II RNA helicase|nr:DUF3516 domain-containing protein [Holophagales bacterium]